MTDYVIDPERPWLGGYLIGGDDATLYPALWDWLVDEFKPGSVLDIGCGEGFALDHFRERGCQVLGYDGIAQPDFDTLEWDFTEGAPEKVGTFDLVWCCEFVEHVEERFMPNFLETFTWAKIVVMTHGMPGQLGHHHVNNQPPSYWKGALAAIGFRFERELTTEARKVAALNQHPSNHFVRSGLVFQAS